MDTLSDLVNLLSPDGMVDKHCRFRGNWESKHDQSTVGVIPYHIVMAGQVRVEVADKQLTLNQGDILLLPHGSPHSLSALKGTGETYLSSGCSGCAKAHLAFTCSDGVAKTRDINHTLSGLYCLLSDTVPYKIWYWGFRVTNAAIPRNNSNNAWKLFCLARITKDRPISKQGCRRLINCSEKANIRDR